MAGKKPPGRGQPGFSGDIEPFTGSLEHQPDGIIFDAAEIIGQTTTRAIAAGSPLRQNQLRQHWRLRNGQTVDIVAQGKGFRIRSAGKALANAAVDDMLKVQTRSGQTVSGKVTADGQVVIFLQE
ncbi:flagellar basal body P-ring biosynthesis protein FlgA [Klebsiella pneumoniae]|nr:flagellar basal body P-ring biosynthesis protein FlgA [Klebsiella pneumoniae]